MSYFGYTIAYLFCLDHLRLLRKDKEEVEALRAAKQLEEAKAQFSVSA